MTGAALKAALGYRALGIAVLPVEPRGKRPALSSWKVYQERLPTEAELAGWFGNGGGEHNLGLVCGAISGIVAVDCDSADAEAWAAEHLPPSPLGTRTAKGRHLFYRHPGNGYAIGNRARITTGEGKLALDVRGDGGYVLGAPSVHPSGVVYERVGDWTRQALEALPRFELSWLAPQEASRPTATPTKPGARVDVRERAARYLERCAPAVSGSGGHNATMRAASALVNGFGLNADEALGLLLAVYNPVCSPPWTEPELRHKVESAKQAGPPAGKSPGWLLEAGRANGVGRSGGAEGSRQRAAARTAERARLAEAARRPGRWLVEIDQNIDVRAGTADKPEQWRVRFRIVDDHPEAPLGVVVEDRVTFSEKAMPRAYALLEAVGVRGQLAPGEPIRPDLVASKRLVLGVRYDPEKKRLEADGFACFHPADAQRGPTGPAAPAPTPAGAPELGASAAGADEERITPPLTDTGNAERLVAEHGDDLRHVAAWKRWLVWDGARWADDESGGAARRAKSTVRGLRVLADEAEARAAACSDPRGRKKLEAVAAAIAAHAHRSESATARRAMLGLAEVEERVAAAPAAFDADDWLFNCDNGTLDLRTGELRPHLREDMLTKRSPAAYDPLAPAPTWLAALDRVFDGNQNVIDYLRRWAGYCMTGSTREHALAIWWGAGSNGKSTILGALRYVFGDYAKHAESSTLLERRSDGPRDDLAALVGRRFVTAVETRDGSRLDEGTVKSITGGDPITCRALYANLFTYTPRFKLVLATNSKPRIRGLDFGIWRRIHLLPFAVRFADGDKDPDLPAKLEAEASGILAWCAAGALEWQEQGLAPPPEVRAATETYQAESDELADFFDEHCLLAPAASARAADLYQTYRRWAERCGTRPLSQRRFGGQLAAHGFVKRRNDGIWWAGLALAREGRA